MRNLPFLAASAAISFFLLWDASEGADQSARLKKTGRRTVVAPGGGSWSVLASGHTGLGQFQDIQVPVNLRAGRRADGTAVAEGNANHLGFPLMGRLGAAYRSGPWQYEMGFNVMRMRALSGPASTQGSSYLRMEVEGGARYRPRRLAPGPLFGVDVAARRSAFRNISNGHYVDAGLIGAHLGWGSVRRWTVTTRAAYAPYTEFGYSEAGFSSGEAFPGSQTSLFEVGVNGGWRLTRNAWFDLGVTQELAEVTVEDVRGYKAFGLNVTPTRERQRVYDLATTVVEAGFRKEF